MHAHVRTGAKGALTELRRRAGGHLDPDLVSAFLADADTVLGALDSPDLLADVVTAEPGSPALIPPDELDRYCLAISTLADLSGGRTGHR